MPDPYLCESLHILKVEDKYYCMPASISINDPNVGIPVGSDCYSKLFNNTQNIDEFTLIKSTSKCGYASNGLSFCDLNLGDR